jgi:hypothetical protein
VMVALRDLSRLDQRPANPASKIVSCHFRFTLPALDSPYGTQTVIN